ncbi:hypothetical protein ACET3Z_005898 [Daucus carota]
MALQSILPVEFLKPIIYGPDSAISDSLKLPRGFVERFGDSLPRNVLVKTMDGEEFRITFSQVDGSFSGMHRLLMKLSAKQLQFLSFKFFGGPKFEVYLLDTNHIMHATPGMHLPFKCKFIKVMYKVSSCWTPVELSEEFIGYYGQTVPQTINYQLSNGSVLDGRYDNEKGRLFGLQQFYKLYNMSWFDTIVLTYNGNNVFNVRGFGKDCMEKRPFMNSIGYFEIEVKPYHLQEYDFGVTIPVKFHGVLDDIGQCENLDIRHGESRWTVLLKKRMKRAELHSGWTLLRKELELKVGDICLFRRTGSKLKFFLDVYRSCL